MHESQKTRFWEVDLLRGLAVVMMIVFHLFYDLNYFGIYRVDISSGFWFYFPRITAGLFILLVGVSLALSYSRTEMQGRKDRIFIKLLKRGLWIFSLGMVVTVVTYLFVEERFIVFGILHFIGVSIILSYPFLRLKALNLGLGAAAIGLGLYLQGLSFPYPWLLWLGLAPDGFYTLDYIPLFPWFGVVLLGIFLGSSLYGGYQRKFILSDLSGLALPGALCLLGRNSLLIYLIHQPLIIAALVLLGGASFLPETASKCLFQIARSWNSPQHPQAKNTRLLIPKRVFYEWISFYERKRSQRYSSRPGGGRGPEERPAHRQEDTRNSERDPDQLVLSSPRH